MTTFRALAIVAVVMAIGSCKWSAQEKAPPREEEQPVISSLKESGLPCFQCHTYEKFSSEKAGVFSHAKHLQLGAHCNKCHTVMAHQEANLRKEACNACHKLTNFTYAGAGMPVNFSHQGHAKKLGCSQCHPKLFTMKKGMTKITMDDMYKGGSCGHCHNGKEAFASTECARCHKMSAFKKEISYPSRTMASAVFSHELHTAIFGCGSCHPALFTYKKGGTGMKMDDLYQGKYCGTCHNGQSAFGSSECQRCHK